VLCAAYSFLPFSVILFLRYTEKTIHAIQILLFEYIGGKPQKLMI